MVKTMLTRRGLAVSSTAVAMALALSCAANADEMADMTSYLQKNMPKVSPDLLTAACSEGKLDILYTNVSNLSKYVDEFESYFPCVEVSAVANGDDDNLARFYAGEKQGTPPDILQLGSQITLVEQVAKKGMLQEFTPTDADKFQSLAPGLVISTDHQAQGILYNTDSIKETDLAAIKTWKDMTHLLDPQFKDKRLGMVDPHGAGGGSYVVAYVLYKEIGSDNVKKILDYLQVTVYPGSGPAVNALASGELDLVIGNEFNAFAASQKGAPVQVWYPEPRSASYTALGIAAKAKHPNAAKLWIEYETSQYGNEQISKYFSMAPGRPDSNDVRPSTKESWYKAPEALYKFDIDDMIKSYDNVVAPFPSK
jgi:ABC-type Fe3+ transport system substrate-binding protein